MTTTGKKVLVILAIVVALVCFVSGLLIGWFFLDDPAKDSQEEQSNGTMSPGRMGGKNGSSAVMGLIDRYLRNADPTVSERLIQEIDSSKIEQHISFLSERPHLAGTAGDQRAVDYIKQQFESMGLDVTQSPYDVLLSYPNDNHFNKVQILDGRGNPVFTSAPGVDTGSEWDSEVTWPYCIYSPSGNVKGKLVYANYGRPHDFKILNRMGVDVKDSIIIIRYGKISRSKKVHEVTKRGGAAVILYNDPADANVNATNGVFPATWWLPGTDVEHGNIRTTWGDPATPGYASTKGAYRIPRDEMDLPSIPCHPVASDDAKLLMLNIKGDKAPDDWQGQLGLPYNMGSSTPESLPVEVNVQNVLETRTVYNVFGTLKGSVEPDRVVLMGSHRDSVAYGAVDPGSGTAVMMEVARAFSALAGQGWTPRRTVMFCSWAAEEFGLIGSTEWVEEKRHWLSNNVVAYLNLDAVLQGNYTFDMSATPTLKDAAIRAASKVPDPHNNSSTVLETWIQRVPEEKDGRTPRIRRPVAYTDFKPFVHLLGIPITHSRYSFVEQDGVVIYNMRNYPLYHSVFDTMPLARMMDPTFTVCKAVAAIMAELTRDLSDSLILPLRPQAFAFDIKEHFRGPLARASGHLNTSVDALQDALLDFGLAASMLRYQIDHMDVIDPFEIRRLNDKLMLFEREFVDHKSGTHLFMTHGSNSRFSVDQEIMSTMTLALRAAESILLS